jgi:hypothetical protein
MELRGDVFDYARTAARALAPDGHFALCHAAFDERPGQSYPAAGLQLWRRLDVWFRRGRPPTISLFVGGHGPAPADLDLPEGVETAADLVAHLRTRTDVQNIDLMTLSGFCRNCLSRWWQEAAADAGHAVETPAAREVVYGMPYKAWQAQHQAEATPEQKAAFAASNPGH